MPLTLDERLKLSEKIVLIPSEDKIAQDLAAQLQESKQELEKTDNTNKKFIDDLKDLIDGYETEVGLIDGDLRTNLEEQNLIDSANKLLGNFFFPNNTTIPLPSAPDGVWKNFQSFSKSVAIGKQYEEVFGSQDNEKSKIDEIQTIIALAEAKSEVTRVTGESCDMDVVSSDTDTQTYMTDIKALVVELRTIINNQRSAIITDDPDSSRQATNNIAINDIDNNIIPAIDAWEAAPDFDPIGSAPTCVDFENTDTSTLDDTKFKPAILDVFKAALTNRELFIIDREVEVENFLGTVNQSIDGTINSTSGLYGQRYRFIELRLNLMTGTLTRLVNVDQAINAQGQIESSNENATLAYDGVIKVSALAAQSNGTDTIYVQDSSDFSEKDVVYVFAKNKPEIKTSIKSIESNKIVLAKKIPTGYGIQNLGRMYKDIT